MFKSDSFTAIRRLGVLGVAPCLILAGCGGDDAQDASEEDSRGSGSLTQTSPLTGLETPDGLPEHPVAVVKVDNTSAAAPQVGLDEADLVVEELVEGGSTRLAAFFWSQTPEEVGPVRSMRATDIGIVSPTDGVLVASGGAPSAVKDIKDAGIKTFSEGAPGYSRDSGRSAPYDLMMDLAKLTDGLEGDTPTDPYLPFGDTGARSDGKPATKVDVEFSSGHTTEWSFEQGTGWVREDSPAGQGDDFVPDNVLTVEVKVGNAGYRDPAGNPVPESEFFGAGPAVLFSGGKALRCEWSKDKPASALTLTRPDGTPVQVPPGRTWIELVPKRGGSVDWKA